MQKRFLTLTLAGTLALGGCAQLGLDGLLGDGAYGNGYGYNNSGDFERAAVDACGRQASRYGRVSINRAQQRDRDFVQVDGRIETRDYRRDEFQCVFRSDGRIVDFKTF